MPGLGGIGLPQTAQVAASFSLIAPHAGQIPSHLSGRTTPLHFPQLTHAYPHDMSFPSEPAPKAYASAKKVSELSYRVTFPAKIPVHRNLLKKFER